MSDELELEEADIMPSVSFKMLEQTNPKRKTVPYVNDHNATHIGKEHPLFRIASDQAENLPNNTPQKTNT